MSGSDSDEETTIRYGTPLEPIEEDEVPSKRKFQPVEQYAVDAHGRRRFHGAFTGGFSAGFGNTVGSQEGWTPATFKSSRSEKAQLSNQRPEDFMDEEDRSEYGIAPRQLETQSEFSGQKRPLQKTYHDGPIPGEPVLGQLLKPVHETAAVKLLKAMGWRQGQGTGERVTKEQKKKAREQQKVYGCYVPPELRQNAPENAESQSDEDSTDSEFDYKTLFAPDDYEPFVIKHKDDRFGLGYQGLSRHSVLGNLVGEYGSQSSDSKSHLVMKEKGKKVSIRGQAFGVGAFEADDEDIYATEDMSHYDFTLGGPVPEKQKPKPKGDGRALEGFTAASKPLPPVPSFPPPAIPRDYVPAAAGTRRTRFEPTDAPQREQGLGRHELTPEARGALLGEKPIENLPEPSKPLADEIIAKVTGRNVKADEMIAKVTGRNVNFVNPEQTPDFISIKDSGKEIKNVFKPFASNPLKQKRYEKYLENKDSLERDSDIDNVSAWEREREMLEFEQAAKLYRPLSGIMGDRFTHASEPDDALNPLCAVAKSTNNYGLATQEQIKAASKGMYGAMTRSVTSWRPESVVCKRFNVPEPGVTRLEPRKDEKQKVSYSIFSYLESSVHDKDSFAKEQSTFSGSKSIHTTINQELHQKQASTVATLQNLQPKTNIQIDQKTINEKESHQKQASTEATPLQNWPPKTNIQTDQQKEAKITKNDGIAKRMTVAELFLKESEANKARGEEVTETINKFDKMDLYKSIFLSDSEEEEFEICDEKTNTLIDFDDKPKNVLRNTSPPRGIFANIDFDEINSWRRNDGKAEDATAKDSNATEKDNSATVKDKNATVKDSNSIVKDSNATVKDKNAMDIDNEVYGPKIPENLLKRIESNQIRASSSKDIIHEVNSSSSDSWVAVNEIKSKKRKIKLNIKKINIKRKNIRKKIDKF